MMTEDKLKGFTKQDIIGIGSTSQRVRNQLVDRVRKQGVVNESVLEVMSMMPRHLFVDEAMKDSAYKDDALPIGHGQTISQPFIVARMTEELLKGEEKPKKVLEVGTGSGYQGAILAALFEQVYTVERIMELHQKTKTLFQRMGFKNIQATHSDGSWGWEQYAPYDAIIATAAPDQIPEQLLLQLAVGGKLVIPVGSQTAEQRLTVVYRVSDHQFETEELELVQFVPFLGGSA